MEPNYWRTCTSCKSPIPFGDQYWVCNVSTCNKKRNRLVFCKVACWDAHVPVMNHRDAWAEEETAPTLQQAKENVAKGGSMTEPNKSGGSEILVVASKVKKYIKSTHGLNTSGSVMEALSEKVRQIVNRACESAKSDGRKTVLDRDF